MEQHEPGSSPASSPARLAVGTRSRASAWTVFAVFLKRGCTSFGGPLAHLGYFRDEFVVRHLDLNQWCVDA